MTKPIMKMCYKLLHVIQGVKSILIKSLTSWPQLISKLLVAPACLHVASDWPRTFFTPKVFLFSIKTYKRRNVVCKLKTYTRRKLMWCVN